MIEEKTVKPQFSYLNQLVLDFLQLTDAIANYRAYESNETARTLLTCITSLYMKVRTKIRFSISVDPTTNKKVRTFDRLIKSMDPYVYSIEGMLTSTKMNKLELLENGADLCRFIETTGITDIETDLKSDPFKAYEDSFPS